MSDVDCSTYATNLFSCGNGGWRSTLQNACDKDAGVICFGEGNCNISVTEQNYCLFKNGWKINS